MRPKEPHAGIMGLRRREKYESNISLDAAASDEREELFSRLGVITEASKHGAGDGLTAGLLDSTHHHAEMATL